MTTQTCLGLEQQWGSTDPALASREVQRAVGQRLINSSDIVTAWGEVLPNPEWARQDLRVIQDVCERPDLWHPPPFPLRILERIRIHELFGCWELPVYDDPKPRARYAVVTARDFGADHEEAHRFMWRCLIGPIPKGYVVDHRCLNKACCWPRHLEPITPLENTRRGRDDRRHVSQRYFGQPEPTVLWVPPTTGYQSSD
jgi:hypothetical protein